MKHYEEVLKLLHDQFDWKLTDSLTTTGKKLVADTIKALKIAENNQTLQLQQTGVSGRSEQLCGNLDENYNCKNMCLTRCVNGKKFYK